MSTVYLPVPASLESLQVLLDSVKKVKAKSISLEKFGQVII